jgi:hypothetical protein
MKDVPVVLQRQDNSTLLPLLIVASILLNILREHKNGLCLEIFLFEAPGVFGLSIFSWDFPPPAVPEFGIQKLIWLGEICPHFPGHLTSSFDFPTLSIQQCR